MNSQRLTLIVADLLMDNKIMESISILKEHISSNEKLNMLVVQSARYNDVVKKIHLGTIDEVASNNEKNKIRLALLDLAKKIEDQIEIKPVFNKNIHKANRLSLALNINGKLILLMIVLPILLVSFLANDQIKSTFGNHKKLNIQEVENCFSFLSKKKTSSKKKKEVIKELLNNFDVKTKVTIKSQFGTIVYESELEQFLRELSFGRHSNIVIEDKSDNSINIRYTN